MNNSDTIFSIDKANNKNEPVPFRKAINNQYIAYLKTLADDNSMDFFSQNICDSNEIQEKTGTFKVASLDNKQILKDDCENKDLVQSVRSKNVITNQRYVQNQNNVWYGKILEIIEKKKAQFKNMCYTHIRNIVLEKILDNNIFLENYCKTASDFYSLFYTEDLKSQKKYFFEEKNRFNQSETFRYSKSKEFDLKKELIERHAKMIDSEFIVLDILNIIGLDEWKKKHFDCCTCLLLLGYIEKWKSYYDFNKCYSIYVGDLKTSLCLVHRTDECLKKFKKKSFEYAPKRVKNHIDEIFVQKPPKKKELLPCTNILIGNGNKNIEVIMKNKENSKKHLHIGKSSSPDKFDRMVKTNKYSIEKKYEITKEFPEINTGKFENNILNKNEIYSAKNMIFEKVLPKQKSANQFLDNEKSNEQIKEIIPTLENYSKVEYKKTEPNNSFSSSLIQQKIEPRNSENVIYKDFSFFSNTFSDLKDTHDLRTDSFIKLKINKEILKKEKESSNDYGIFKLSIDVKRIETTENTGKYIGNPQTQLESTKDQNLQDNTHLDKPYFANNEQKNAESYCESEYNLKTGKWTADEDKRLSDLVNKYSCDNWAKIAKLVKTRSGKQCRERWKNHLNPLVTKKPISEEEAHIIFEAQSRIGNKWCKISELLPGRSENTVKNFYFSYQRKNRKQH